MRRDRVATDIYTFTSDLYAQVNASVIMTPEGSIVIDTLPFPDETRAIKAFIEASGYAPVRYVINTHYHSDHSNGNYLFPEAEIVAHASCRRTLERWGEQNLAEAKRETPSLQEIRVTPPNVVFERELYLHLADRSLLLLHTPGHTIDSISVFVDGEKILFAGDAILPVPYIVWGGVEETIHTYSILQELKPDSVVQGHGQLLLRGELPDEIRSSVFYLRCIRDRVQKLVEQGAPQSALLDIDIEACGKSRIPLNGLVRYLHEENLISLYSRMTERERRSSTRAPVI